MALKAPEKQARPLIEAGPTRGNCYMVVDLGTAKNDFDGKMKHQVLLGFELSDHRDVFERDGKKIESARTINKFLTLSMNEKASLRKVIGAWRGKNLTDEEAKEFDLFSLVGKAALINITHKDSASGPKADIGSITSLPRGMTAATMEHPEIKFSLSDPDHNQFTGDMQPWVQAIVMKSNEWIAEHGDASGTAVDESPDVF